MQKHYVITVLAREATMESGKQVEQLLSAAGLAVNSAEQPAIVKPDELWTVHLHASGDDGNLPGLKDSLLAFCQQSGLDVVVQEAGQFGRRRRLIVFDMDSTLIQAEIIDELAKLKGVGEEVSRVTAAAMRGELDFKQSFTRRLSLLEGVPETEVYELLHRVPLTPGAEKLIRSLKAQGYKTAVLSGGFTFFGRHLQTRLGIDYLFANELEIRDGHVTGKVVPPIMDGERKAEMLRFISDNEGIPLDEAIAVGDGANDLPMLRLAGMGIAYHAKPLVRRSAQHSISTLGLDAILPLLGMQGVGSRSVQ